jgi:hypothetical protein
MSALGDFVAAAIAEAFPIIGTSIISIGGGAGVACVTNQVTHSSDHEDSVFAPMADYSAVIATPAFLAAYTDAPKSYIGRTAVIDSNKYRVASVTVGASHVIVNLSTVTRS